MKSGGPNSERVTVLLLENQVTDRQANIHTIFEFPDKESVLARHGRDQYKAALPARMANTYLAVVDGVDDQQQLCSTSEKD